MFINMMQCVNSTNDSCSQLLILIAPLKHMRISSFCSVVCHIYSHHQWLLQQTKKEVATTRPIQLIGKWRIWSITSPNKRWPR